MSELNKRMITMNNSGGSFLSPRVAIILSNQKDGRALTDAALAFLNGDIENATFTLSEETKKILEREEKKLEKK